MSRIVRSALLVALLFAFGGCKRPAPTPPPPAGAPNDDSAAEGQQPADDEGGRGQGAGQAAEPADGTADSTNSAANGDSTDGEATDGDGDGVISCGSRGLAPCPEGMFCDFGDDDCGATDAPGRCTEIPGACIEIYQPVCACDGKTYGNTCKAHAAGVDQSKYCEPEAAK